jgi:hypothetical protein
VNIQFRVPTLRRALLGAAVALAFVATAKGLLSGHFEVLTLLVPIGLFLAAYWLVMHTLAEDGVIHQFLRRHRLIRRQDR